MHLTATLVLATMPAREDSHTQRPARLLGAGSGPSGLRPRGRILGWCGKKCRVCRSCDVLPLTYTVGWRLIRPTACHPLVQSLPRRLACTCTLPASYRSRLTEVSTSD
jgi:hypothetical protein